MRSIAVPVDLITFKVDHMAACSSTRTFLSVLPGDSMVSEPRVELRCNSYFDSHRIAMYEWHFGETAQTGVKS